MKKNCNKNKWRDDDDEAAMTSPLMYKEEKEKHRERRSTSGVGMPKKWTHLEFMVELVYDLIFPGRTCAHLWTISELDDRSISSTKTLSSFESVDEAQLEEEFDTHLYR